MALPSFLDKLTGTWQRQGALSAPEQVRQNLEAVLNTKEGYGYFVEGFGLGRFTEKLGTKELMKALVAEMEHSIRRYEPRLEGVELELRGRDSGLWLHFLLTGTLHGTPCKWRVLFHTVSGQVRVEGDEEE